MEFNHVMHFASEDKVDQTLEELSIKYTKTLLPAIQGYGYQESSNQTRYLITFQIMESDKRWPLVRDIALSVGKKLTTGQTIFSKEEILDAQWLRMFGFPSKGYPQPEGKWQREHFNYSFKCKKCGVFHQKSGFYLKMEPKMGKNDFMSLNWTSAVFAVPRVFAALEANHIKGYEQWPALIYKTKEPSTNVSQLYVQALDQPAVVNAIELQPIICQSCGLIKYQKHHQRGVMYLTREAIPTGLDMFETYEWFGEGFQPYRELIVSNKVAQLAYAEGWRGVTFKVIEVI